eukprot:c2577_g1_i1.p1 GENE.c2577_g1_i1~~c2577_g1_i1.p1  ORF type:complete len:143 (+),score=26.38 c2577_g1_i1:39-467(+)
MEEQLRMLFRKQPRTLSECLSHLSIPTSSNQATSRVEKNLSYFAANYVMIVVIGFLLSSLANPAILIILATIAVSFVCFVDPSIVGLEDHLTVAVAAVLGNCLLITILNCWQSVWLLSSAAPLILLHALFREAPSKFSLKSW